MEENEKLQTSSPQDVEAQVPPVAPVPIDADTVAPIARLGNGAPDWLANPTLAGIHLPLNTAPNSGRSTPAGPSRVSSIVRKPLPANAKATVVFAEPPAQQLSEAPVPVPAPIVVPEAQSAPPAVIQDDRTQHIFHGPFNNCTLQLGQPPLERKPSLLQKAAANRLSFRGLPRVLSRANEAARPSVENLRVFGRAVIGKFRPDGGVLRRNRDPDLIPEDGEEDDESVERLAGRPPLRPSGLDHTGEHQAVRRVPSVQSLQQDLDAGCRTLRVVSAPTPSPPSTPAPQPVPLQTGQVWISSVNDGGDQQDALVEGEVTPDEGGFRDTDIFTDSILEVKPPTPGPVPPHAATQRPSQPNLRPPITMHQPSQIPRRPVSMAAPAQTQRAPEVMGRYPVFSLVEHDDNESLNSMRNNVPTPENISRELGRSRVHPAAQEWAMVPPATMPLDQWHDRYMQGLVRGLDGVPAPMPTVPERECDKKLMEIDRSITPNTRAILKEKNAQKFLRGRM